VREAVVDASVSAKWVVEEQYSAKAALLLQCDALHAPDHWHAEAVNVLWSKVVNGDLSPTDAEERMAVLLRAPVAGTPITGLMPRAFAISVSNAVTIYDSLYVALAEKRGIPLVTADRRLIRGISGDGALAKLIVWVGICHPDAAHAVPILATTPGNLVSTATDLRIISQDLCWRQANGGR
jgi:predicted nucleic acid-binding protein